MAMHSKQPGQAFTGLAEDYAKARPAYPRELYAALLAFWRSHKPALKKMPIILDVGCGTGISTRAIYLATEGQSKVFGIEPSHDMYQTAQATTIEPIIYIKGSAEAIPFAANSIDIVTAAQAIHWFDRPAFYKQAKRVLKMQGVLAIYENNRDWERSDFLRRHEEFLEQYACRSDGTPYSRHYRVFPYEKELQEHFSQVSVERFYWERTMTANEFLTMAKSSTQVQNAINYIGEPRVKDFILKNIQTYFPDQKNVIVPYCAKLHMARKTQLMA